MEKGEGQKYRGKSLDEIDISANDLISADEEEEYGVDDDFNEKDSSPVLNKNQTIEPIMEEPYSELPIIKKQKKKSIMIIPWSEKEKHLATQHFKNHILLNKAAKKNECEHFMNLNKISKPWKRVKDFVHIAAISYKNKIK